MWKKKQAISTVGILCFLQACNTVNRTALSCLFFIAFVLAGVRTVIVRTASLGSSSWKNRRQSNEKACHLPITTFYIHPHELTAWELFLPLQRNPLASLYILHLAWHHKNRLMILLTIIYWSLDTKSGEYIVKDSTRVCCTFNMVRYLGNGDGLLFHGLVNAGTIVFSNTVELIWGEIPNRQFLSWSAIIHGLLLFVTSCKTWVIRHTSNVLFQY